MNAPKKYSVLLLGLASLLLFLGATAASAEVLYSQTFDNSGSEKSFNGIMNPLGWTVYSAATGATTTTPSVQGGGRIFSSPPANANGGTTSALVFLGTDINVSQDSVSSISFDSVQSSTTGRVRILIEIGTQWYASNTIFIPIKASAWPADESTSTLTLDFSTAAADWSLATLTPSAPMTIAGTALADDLPTGNITGIGWWDSNTHTSNGVTVRLDNMTISSATIPEPATWTLLAGAASLIGVLLLRRRRA